MSPQSKKKYIETIFLRYKKASTKEKTVILNEFCATSGFHRKHAIRVLRKFKRFAQSQPKKRERVPLYQPHLLLKPFSQIWRTANLPCSKRLKAFLPLRLLGYVDLEQNFLTELSIEKDIILNKKVPLNSTIAGISKRVRIQFYYLIFI